jgi:signal transduction histidine kinase
MMAGAGLPGRVVTVWSSLTGWLVVVSALAVLTAVAAATALVRTRRAFTHALQDRGWLLERERENAAQGAVDAERARIARELHDIVSHNVSVMVIQAGAARKVLTAHLGEAPRANETEGTNEAEAALRAVETAGRNTMTELRHLLGVLAPSGEGDDELSPQPSLRRLGPLIDRIAFAGLPVEVRISGEPRPLPSGVDLTAYRIIQEALTNALKHGDRAKAEVTVRYTDNYLRVEVLNSGPSVLAGSQRRGPGQNGSEPSAAELSSAEGRGLLGLRQRVAVFGGDLDARRRLGGGFRVRAKIPLDRP